MSPASPTYSIGDVAQATGLSPETIRIWERRYGRPKPHRLPSGHRRFDESQLRWLRRVTEALARGHRPGDVVTLPPEALDALLAAKSAVAADDAPWPTWLEDVRAFDEGMVRDQLARWWTPDAPVTYLEQRVAPLLVAIGRAWTDGELQVRHEHFVSTLVDEALHAHTRSYPTVVGAARVVIATMSGELHRLGVSMVQLLCASHGIGTRVLGQDTPVAEIAATAHETKAPIVAISVSLSSGGIQTDRTLSSLRDALPDHVELCVGGAGARGVRRGPRGITYFDSLADWDRRLRQLHDDTSANMNS